MSTTRLSDRIVDRRDLETHGASGSRLERVVLDDGRTLIRKHASPEWDWISRATGDDGRALRMWQTGVFDRIPAGVDHTVVAVEAEEQGWSVFMRDVSATLVPDGRRVTRDDVGTILAGVAALHHSFDGQTFPELCSLEQRYRLLSPATATHEIQHGDPERGALIERCWDLFAELAPTEIASPVLVLADDPAPLAEQLARRPQTLVHGDVRLSNLGLDGDRLVLVDWGERTGSAPAPVELASFLAFDARRMDVTREMVIDDYRRLAGDGFDDVALQLALIGGLVQLGTMLVLEVALGGGEEALAAAREELAWWSAAAATALETWSPV